MVKCFELLRRKVLHKYRVVFHMKNSCNTLNIATKRHNQLPIYFFSQCRRFLTLKETIFIYGLANTSSLSIVVPLIHFWNLNSYQTHYQSFLFLTPETLEEPSVPFSLLKPKSLQLFFGNFYYLFCFIFISLDTPSEL